MSNSKPTVDKGATEKEGQPSACGTKVKEDQPSGFGTKVKEEVCKDTEKEDQSLEEDDEEEEGFTLSFDDYDTKLAIAMQRLLLGKKYAFKRTWEEAIGVSDDEDDKPPVPDKVGPSGAAKDAEA